MNRATLQQLSDERIGDARALLAANQWLGAYSLAGYALECALKSCVLAYIDQTQAEKLFHALTDNTDGVLPWVKNYW